MFVRYRTGLALTSLLMLAAPAAHASVAHAHAHVRPQPIAPPTAADLFSRRALRRARIILQLKMLELRAERLDRVRKAIEQGIPIDDLLKDEMTGGRCGARETMSKRSRSISGWHAFHWMEESSTWVYPLRPRVKQMVFPRWSIPSPRRQKLLKHCALRRRGDGPAS